MVERIDDFFSHSELMNSTHAKANALERLIDVTRYFLSGWYIRPKVCTILFYLVKELILFRG
jgi:hypothetical protein